MFVTSVRGLIVIGFELSKRVGYGAIRHDRNAHGFGKHGPGAFSVMLRLSRVHVHHTGTTASRPNTPAPNMMVSKGITAL